MQRKPPFLVASLAETARYVGLAFLAEATGALSASEGLPALFRYAAAPQLLFVAAFFFLWLDEERYGAFRLLLLAGKAVSLLAFFPLILALLSGGFPMLSGRAASAAALLSLAVDLFGLLVLLILRLAARSGAGTAGASPADATGQPGSPGPSGPRGPEDIEKLEG